MYNLIIWATIGYNYGPSAQWQLADKRGPPAHLGDHRKISTNCSMFPCIIGNMANPNIGNIRIGHIPNINNGNIE